MNTPRVAVIVAARDAQATMKQCLNALLVLDYPDYEIIVVDDGSKDNTPGILKEYSNRVRAITLTGRGPSAARNAAVRQTDAEYIAFTDSDCIVDRKWLHELLEGLSEYPRAVACGGRQELPKDASGFEEKVFLFMKKAGIISDYVRRSNERDIIEVRHNPSCNVLYKKDIFLKERGFLEGLWPGEDVEFDYRLEQGGNKLAYNPKAVVYHYRPKSFKSFLAMMYRYGFAQGRLVRKYGMFRKIHFLPIVGIVFLSLCLVSILWNPFFAFGITLSCGLFALWYCADFIVAELLLCGGIFWTAGFARGFLNVDQCSQNN